jgi:hypothetical protein
MPLHGKRALLSDYILCGPDSVKKYIEKTKTRLAPCYNPSSVRLPKFAPSNADITRNKVVAWSFRPNAYVLGKPSSRAFFFIPAQAASSPRPSYGRRPRATSNYVCTPLSKNKSRASLLRPRDVCLEKRKMFTPPFPPSSLPMVGSMWP